ncbi:MAG: integrin alpha [Planctomycetota bacterium]
MHRARSFLTLLVSCLFGSAGGSAQELLWSIDGEHSGDELGHALAGGKDVDGDQVPDVTVGSPWYDGVAGADCGKVLVISGATQLTLLSLEGEGEGDGFGSAVALMGDTDGDGRADLLVGAPYHDGPAGTRSGKVYLYSGSTGLLIRAWNGEAGGELGDLFGFSVSGAGDVDGDLVEEIIVGAPQHDGAAGVWCGKAYVYSGASGALLWSWEGEMTVSEFGHSVAGAGDFDDDGRADLLVGAPYFSSPDRYVGKAYLLSGATGSLLWSRVGELGVSLYGFSVASAGDTDRDSLADFVIAAPEQDTEIDINIGKVFLYAGGSGSELATWAGDLRDVVFGRSVAGAGDVDGDGAADVLVGAYGYWGDTGWGYGRAFVYSGATSGLLLTWGGEAELDLLGIAVASAGDVNQDGLADVVLGASWHDGPGGWDAGRAYVYSGKRCELNFTAFGTGTAGTGGFVPALSGEGSSCDGGDYVVRITNALGGATGVLWVGAGSGDLSPFFGGHFYIDFGSPYTTFAIVLGGAPGVGGAGFLELRGPSLRGWQGLVLYLQATLLDDGGTNGVVLTNALEMAIGP